MTQRKKPFKMNSLFSTSDLNTMLPAITLIVLSVGLISNKNRITSFLKSAKSFLF